MQHQGGRLVQLCHSSGCKKRDPGGDASSKQRFVRGEVVQYRANEKRVAAGLAVHVKRDSVRLGNAESGARQFGDALTAKSGERNAQTMLVFDRLGDQTLPWAGIRTSGHHDGEPAGPLTIHEVPENLDRLDVRPVKIVDHEDHWAAAGMPSQNLVDRCTEVATFELCVTEPRRTLVG